MKPSYILLAGILLFPATSFAKDGFQHSLPRGFLGVHVQTMTKDLRTYFGAPEDRGVLVASVEEEGPAGKAGIRAGDVILTIDEADLSDPSDLIAHVTGLEKGTLVALQIIRNKRRQTVNVVLTEKSPRMGWPDLKRAFPKGFEFNPWIYMPRGGDLAERLKNLEDRLEKLEKKVL